MTYETIILDITARYPDLDIAGLDKFSRADGNGDWLQYEGAFFASVDYLRGMKRTVAYPRHAPSSYGLKHDVERLTNAKGARVYVPNGIMIAALIHAGVAFKRDGINATARLSSRSRYREVAA